MSSVKVILYKSKKKADGKHPIALRVIKDRKPSYFYLEWIDERYWDPKKLKVKNSYHSAPRLNNLILKKITAADDLILRFEAENETYTSSRITNALKGNSTTSLLFEYTQEYFESLYKLEKYSRAITDEGRIKQFKEFLGNRNISFEEITIALLNKFKVYLATKQKVSERSIMNSLVVIRTIFNRAINDGIVEQKYYPFGKNKIHIKFPQTIKIGLDEKEMIAIEELDLKKGSTIWHSRNIFLFSFYLAGMRVSDVLRVKWNDIKGDRLYYQMEKNKKVDSLKLPNKVIEILGFYTNNKKDPDDYIFPELKKAKKNDSKDQYRKTKTAIKKFNNYLEEIAKKAEIDKKVTMHIARHSFGNIAGDKISPYMLQKLYRHSNLSTTIGYQANFMHKDTDQALDSVLNF
ncbi:site-specific integrase [Aquimarina algiphila]|uniref:Tyrosine-type recombinase/integrase n=1 Tax=Aquimarina algiphila TaxID=2047982 RepID=A0A554VK46_9FLAO|nr:site-specific integrase [Aquimarina algiphila]TSE08321.1 tyrosine-type recombinase/integrase [Aquimarina algiphila]